MAFLSLFYCILVFLSSNNCKEDKNFIYPKTSMSKCDHRVNSCQRCTCKHIQIVCFLPRRYDIKRRELTGHFLTFYVEGMYSLESAFGLRETSQNSYHPTWKEIWSLKLKLLITFHVENKIFPKQFL